MAKLTAPLMSFDARGQLAKSLVFLGWKGIKTVRQYVVPANPKTTKQVAQRLLMTYCVSRWHDMVSLMKESWNLWAGYEVLPMAGFNSWVKQGIASLIADPLHGYSDEASFTAGDTIIDVACQLKKISDNSEIVTGTVYAVKYGLDPRDLDSEEDMTYVATEWTYQITGLTNDIPVYMRIFSTATSKYMSGLFVATPVA